MIKTFFSVVFRTGIVEEVWAFDLKEALIVAQARQIEKGRDYRVARAVIGCAKHGKVAA